MLRFNKTAKINLNNTPALNRTFLRRSHVVHSVSVAQSQ